MSSIDSASSVHCANVHLKSSIIPVYWVITPLEHDTTSNEITKRDLVIGGGSGEHPMLQIQNADLLPLWLMSYGMMEDEPVVNACEEIYMSKMLERIQHEEDKKTFTNYPHVFNNFYCFSEWPLSTTSKIQKCYEKAKKTKGKSYLANSAEAAFLMDIAIFVMFDMPQEFLEDDVYRTMKDHEESLWQHDIVRISHFSRPLKSSKMGKIIKEGKAVWGYDLEDYLKDLRSA